MPYATLSTKDSMKTYFTLCHAIEVPHWPAMICVNVAYSVRRGSELPVCGYKAGPGTCSLEWSKRINCSALIQEIFQCCIPIWQKIQALV